MESANFFYTEDPNVYSAWRTRHVGPLGPDTSPPPVLLVRVPPRPGASRPGAERPRPLRAPALGLTRLARALPAPSLTSRVSTAVRPLPRRRAAVPPSLPTWERPSPWR